jgi:hypothetical protein
MKTLVTASLLALSLVFVGCASKVGEPEPLNIKQLTNKVKQLPAWATTDANFYQSSGSAQYRGQSFTEQKSEAESTAYASLVRRLETKVDVILKNHYAVSGTGKSPYIEKYHQQTTSQLSSLVISHSRIVDTYLSPEDGELFVLIEVDENSVNKLTESTEKAFKELDEKAEKFNAEKERKAKK